MAKGKPTFGYSRRPESPDEVHCPRKPLDAEPTPYCAVEAGAIGTEDVIFLCTYCGKNPADLLQDLVERLTEPTEPVDD